MERAELTVNTLFYPEVRAGWNLLKAELRPGVRRIELVRSWLGESRWRLRSELPLCRTGSAWEPSNPRRVYIREPLGQLLENVAEMTRARSAAVYELRCCWYSALYRLWLDFANALVEAELIPAQSFYVKVQLALDQCDSWQTARQLALRFGLLGVESEVDCWSCDVVRFLSPVWSGGDAPSIVKQHILELNREALRIELAARDWESGSGTWVGNFVRSSSRVSLVERAKAGRCVRIRLLLLELE